MHGVDLYRIALDDSIGDLSLLSADEVERAARFTQERSRQRFIAARGALRSILARYTGGEPGELTFSYSARGRPSLTNQVLPLDFSLAHSGGTALLAVCRHRVGADVEYLHRPLCDPMEIAQSCYSPGELAALSRLRPEERRRAFLTAWTRKEAVAKASGIGVAAMAEIEVEPESVESEMVVVGPGGTDWRVTGIGMEGGYVAAVATPFTLVV